MAEFNLSQKKCLLQETAVEAGDNNIQCGFMLCKIPSYAYSGIQLFCHDRFGKRGFQFH